MTLEEVLADKRKIWTIQCQIDTERYHCFLEDMESLGYDIRRYSGIQIASYTQINMGRAHQEEVDVAVKLLEHICTKEVYTASKEYFVK